MSTLELPTATFLDVSRVGLAIRTFGANYHCGIIYRLGAEARLLHFAMHHDLRDEPIDLPYRWCQISLDDDNKVVLSALLSRIISKNPNIPYGFNSDGIAFDENGDLLPGPPGRGLTCATFILAVFRLYGHQILADEEWEYRPEDDEWRDFILGLLEGRADHDHIWAVANDRNAPRYRPEEVVGGSTAAVWPVGLPDALVLANSVRSDLATA